MPEPTDTGNAAWSMAQLTSVSPRPAIIPLSYAQRRVWFLDRLNKGSPQFNLVGLLRLRGALPLPAVRFALDFVVRRHESLRTRVTDINGEPQQTVDPVCAIELPVIDLSGLDPSEQQQRIRRERLHQRSWPFDLSRGPLFRAVLLHLAPDDHVLIRSIHHIVCDGWSGTIFDRQVLDMYHSYRAGRMDQSPPACPIQYADFALWQRSGADECRHTALLTYWQRQLEGLPDSAVARQMAPRGWSTGAITGDACHLTFSAEQTGGIKRLAQASHATVYMTLLAVFAVLISRHAGLNDFGVGCPVASRPDPNLERLIGLFVNIVVLRVKPRPELDFIDLLAQVRRTALEAYKHQDLPFERLVEELAPARALGRAPLFDVLFGARTFPVMKPSPDAGVATTRLVEELIGGTQPIGYDLEVFVSDHGGTIGVTWFYNTKAFDEVFIRGLTGCFVNLIEAVIGDPQQKVGRIPMVTRKEQEQLLRFSTGTSDVLRATEGRG